MGLCSALAECHVLRGLFVWVAAQGASELLRAKRPVLLVLEAAEAERCALFAS